MAPILPRPGNVQPHGLTDRVLVPHALEEVSRYLGHSSTMPTRRYAQQTAEALGVRAADALARAGLVPDLRRT